MSLSSLRRSIRLSQKNNDKWRVKIDQYRLKKLETENKTIDLETARTEIQGPILTKKDILDLWNKQFGNDKIFGDCALCENKNFVNPIYANVIELKKTKTKIFVCYQCKADAPDGWIHKRVITPTVEKQRLQVWLNINTVRRRSLCFCCQLVAMDILSSDWHAGHIVAEANGGIKNIDNLRPVCSGCNQDMNTKNMYSYMKEKYEKTATDQKVDVELIEQCLRMLKI